MKAKFLALAALVLGLASCQTEPEGLGVNVGGEVDTYVTVSLPEATRANSALGAFDNVVASNEYTIRYIFQVFYNGDESNAKRQVIYTDEEIVSFPVRLVPGRHYNFVVWADVTTTANKELNTIHNLTIDEAAAADIHYNTTNLKAVKIIDNQWVAMDETRDAFTGQFNTAVDGDQTAYNGAKSINITLTRPFAKLRVITTDMEQLNDLVITPTYAEVVYTTDLYSSFDAFAGAVNDTKTTKTHDKFVIKGYTDNVDDKSKVLFTDYLFAADQDEVVNFTLTVYDQDDVVIGKTINFNTPIPARRNYLTTISGNILTDGNKIEVTVEDTFANYDENGNLTDPNYEYATISSVAELLAAIDANNGEYILISDLDVNGVTASALAATRSTGAGTTINLNGYTIKLQKDIVIPEGNTLIINNDPVDDAGNDEGAIVSVNGKAIVNNGTLIIEGGNFGENTIVNNGTANVSGGNFADDAIVNNGSVSVEGDNSGEEDRIIENGTNAVVSNIVYTVEELQAALDEGYVDEIIFGANLVGDATIFQREGVNVNINGDNKKFDGTIYVQGGSRNNGAETLKIANINFETESAKYFIYANYRTEPERYAHNVTIEKCTFTSLAGDNRELVCGASFRQAFNVTIKDCTATNTFYLAWFTGSVGTTIEGCKAINNYEGITVGNGTTSVVKNTEISSSTYGLRVESNNSNYADTHNVTIENCKLDAFIPVSVRNLTSGKFNLELNGSNVLTRGGLYDIALCSNEYKEGGEVAKAPTCEWTISGTDNFIVFPREVYVAPGFYQTSTGYTIKNAAENSTITLADNVNGAISIEKVKNITIEGNENTNVRFVTTANSKLENVTIKNANFVFVTGAGQAGAFVVINKDAQIDNLVIEGCNIVGDGNKNSYGITGQNPNASIVVKNCKFANVGYAIQTLAGGGYKSLTVNECKFDNIVSWAIIPQYGYTGYLTINSCEFNNSKGGLVKTGTFNGTFTFTNNALTSCTGHDGKDSKWFEVNASAATKVVSGNVKDGVEWVPGTEQGLK